MSALPKGWTQTPVTSITTLLDARRVPLNAKQRADMRGDYPYFGANGLVDHISDYIFDGDYVLLAEDGGYFDDPVRGVAYQASGKFWVNNHAHILEPLGGISTGFLCRLLNAVNWMPYVGGSTRLKLTQGGLQQAAVWLPPVEEQQRIEGKLDSLSAKSKRARENLDHIPRLVEKYKQAVLAAAFRGDLTKEWRKRIGVEDDWSTSTISDIATIASGQTPKGIDQRLDGAGEVPWFKVSSMNEPDNRAGLRVSRFRLSRSDAKQLGLRRFPVGSIAFPKRGGAIATNKKRRLLVEGALDLNLMVLTATGVAPEFLWWWMQGLDLASISNGSNVPQINNGDIEGLEIPVPPPDEQREIARRLEAAYAWIDRLAHEATSARTLVDRLDQAVLAKAFRGELVPQDPSDEPASGLLERIKSDEPAGKPRGGRGRSK